MNTTKAVYNKLFSKKTELETHKVELGLVQDIEKIYKKALSDFDKATEIKREASRMYLDAKDSFSKVIKDTEKLIKTAKDLGIDVPQVDGILKDSQRLEKLSSEFQKELR